MRRKRWHIFASAVVIVAAILLADGRTMSTLLPVGDIPDLDFATLQKSDKPNQYLLCPQDYCLAATDGESPQFEVPVQDLRSAWEGMIAEQPRLLMLRENNAAQQIDYVQRSLLLRFPDLITVRFLPAGESQSTLAIYSRSIYGRSDLGVNQRRVTTWIEQLEKKLATLPR